MDRYVSFSARQIHALAPMGPPVFIPGPLWFALPTRVRAVAYRLGGGRAEFDAANAAYSEALTTLASIPGGPWFPGLWARHAAITGHRRFRWDPQGKLSWPEIYVVVEHYYRCCPAEDIWKGALTTKSERAAVQTPKKEHISEFYPHDQVPSEPRVAVPRVDPQ